MFTGIITDIGRVGALEQRGDLRARIGTSYDIAGIDIGASIACDGVCLTVVALGEDPRHQVRVGPGHQQIVADDDDDLLGIGRQ